MDESVEAGMKNHQDGVDRTLEEGSSQGISDEMKKEIARQLRNELKPNTTRNRSLKDRLMQEAHDRLVAWAGRRPRT